MKSHNLKLVSIITVILLTLSQGYNAYAFDEGTSSNSNQLSTSSDLNNKSFSSAEVISNRPFVQGEVIIKYKNQATPIEKQSALNKVNSLSIKQRNTDLNEDVVKISPIETVQDTVSKLKQDKNVEFAQPNYIYTAKDFSDEPLSSYQWGMVNNGQDIMNSTGTSGVDINLQNAWNITEGSPEVVVGVVDTGIDINHPDLKDRIWVNSDVQADKNQYPNDVNGWDFYNNDNIVFDRSDGDDHGTHVAGIIAASLNNIGVSGVAPNVKIMPLKFMGPDGGTTYDAIRAIQYAESKGVKILNFSWGGMDYDSALKDAISNSGCLVIAAAGNDGTNNDAAPDYPASYKLDNIISVAAIDNRGNLADFSNYGPNTVTVAAPGVDILSTVPKGFNGYSYRTAYDYYSGTSMAAPFVAGIAALLYSVGVHDPLTIKQDIIKGSKPISSLKGKIITGGMVDAYNALMAASISNQSGTKYTRLAGSDRYSTALQISKTGWSTADTVVLASGANFPDALSAVPLAKKYNAPILLTDGKSITSEIAAELNRLKTKNVFIIGGASSISSDIDHALDMMNISYTRLGGSNRYETSLDIANYLGSSTKAFIVSGENFPDALSIASYAAAKGSPILLTPRDELPTGILNYINNNGVVNTYVIGGPGVISNSILSELPNAQRIYGNNRYETNFQVLSTFKNDFDLTTLYFASGRNFPDALSGSALAATTNSPILLIGNDENTDINSFIITNVKQITNREIIGGEGALSSKEFEGIV